MSQERIEAHMAMIEALEADPSLAPAMMAQLEAEGLEDELNEIIDWMDER